MTVVHTYFYIALPQSYPGFPKCANNQPGKPIETFFFLYTCLMPEFRK